MRWFCEYSAKQRAFHVAPAEDCVTENCKILRRGGNPSFVPVGLFASREEAISFCTDFRNELLQGCNVG